MAVANNHTRTQTEDTARGVMQDVSEKASELAEKAGQKVGQQVDKAMENAEYAARSVADGSRDASERVTEVAGNLKTAVNKSVRDQPMATLAVAAGLGFVLGALWKS